MSSLLPSRAINFILILLDRPPVNLETPPPLYLQWQDTESSETDSSQLLHDCFLSYQTVLVAFFVELVVLIALSLLSLSILIHSRSQQLFYLFNLVS